MASIYLRFASLIALGVLAAGCASNQASKSPRISLIPVSDKADRSQGLDMVYVYGTNQSMFNHVACNRLQTCWVSGDMAFGRKSVNRLSPIVLRVKKDDSISWARSYQIDHIFTTTNGLLTTGDGGAILYGNSFVGTRTHWVTKGRIQPVYEKLNASGIPQWGGTVPFGFIKPWSAVTDVIHLADGGYALTGSGTLNLGNDWYGLVMSLKADGSVGWLKFMRIRNDGTLSFYLYQLKNGHILVLGYDAALSDMFLVNLSRSGTADGISILGIRGDEVPVGMVPLKGGPAIVARQKMPSGEIAALIVQLDDKGAIVNARRYHYVDGFNPSDVISLPDHRACLYGYTEAKDKRQSLAFVVNADGKPSSALALKGDSVFNSGALLNPRQVIFAGGRALGVNQRLSALIVKWNPSIGNETRVLKGIRQDVVKVHLYKDQPGKVASPSNPSLHSFDRSEMQSQLIRLEPIRN